MRLSVGRKKIRIGDVLVAAGAITEEQLQEGLAKQKETGRKLGNALVDLGFISNDMLITVLTTQLGIDYIELKGAKIEEKVIHMVPENMVTKYQAIPIEIDPDNPNILKVAMADPMDIMAMDDIGLVTNLQVEPMLASEEGIKNAIDKYYGSAQAMEAAEAYRQEQASALGGGDEEEGNEEIDNSPIVLLVKQIIEGGVRQRASDIHIEALENSVRVRYRIDGALKQVMSYDLSILAGITARIKIIGGMDIAEKRKPQDGRITIMVDRREFDVRVSILPTVFGEKTVMRLTSKDGLTKPKSALGFDAEQEKVFDNILSNPHGIILVTGPTGSGKSTTLYTSLSELNTEDVNIITVEDPVEANINGINQERSETVRQQESPYRPLSQDIWLCQHCILTQRLRPSPVLSIWVLSHISPVMLLLELLHRDLCEDFVPHVSSRDLWRMRREFSSVFRLTRRMSSSTSHRDAHCVTTQDTQDVSVCMR